MTLLSTHYRQPLDVTRDRIADFKRWLDKFYRVLRLVKDIEPHPEVKPAEIVLKALKNDLNTWQAISALDQIAGWLNQDRGDFQKSIDKATLLRSGELLGLLQQDPEDWFKGKFVGYAPKVTEGISEAWIDERIAARNSARKAKDFAEADRIRDELKARGIELEDTPQGTIWKSGN